MTTYSAERRQTALAIRTTWLRSLVGACLVFVAGTASAQPGTVPRIGLLDGGSVAGRAPLWEAFRAGMRELGYVEGRTVSFEIRMADGKYERLPALSAELIRLRVDVIVTASNSAAQAARRKTTTVPIVMATGSDPVGVGLVTSLARPGGNVTGVTTLSRELSAKRFELAREVAPGASRLAILWDAGGGESMVSQSRDAEAAGRALGVRVHAVSVRNPAELDGVFSTVVKERAAALLVVPSPLFFGERRRLGELALKHRLPTVHGAHEYAEAGGLIAYGPNRAELFRRVAVYVDKILKGAKPGDLPIEQPTKFELVINLKTAKALGLTIPRSLLLKADEVIQ